MKNFIKPILGLAMVGMMSVAASAQESGAGWYNGVWYDHNPNPAQFNRNYDINRNYYNESGAGWYNGRWYDYNPYLNNDGYYRSYNYDSRYYNNNRNNNGYYYRNGYYYDNLGRRILNDLLNNSPR